MGSPVLDVGSEFVFCMRIRRPVRSALFPYTTLFRSSGITVVSATTSGEIDVLLSGTLSGATIGAGGFVDRKSTRLNSSHLGTAYALVRLGGTSDPGLIYSGGTIEIGSGFTLNLTSGQ